MSLLKRKFYQTYLALLKFFNCSDSEISKVQFLLKNGFVPDIDNPKEFVEKTLWLKLNYYKEDFGKYVDKYEVREFIEEKIGGTFLKQLLGVYDSFDEINFEKLPNQFAMKCTHGSGYNIIVTEKEKLDINQTRKKINKFLSQNYYKKFREAVYKNLKPRIIIEKYISEIDNEPIIDYKFNCFHGEPKYIYVQQKKLETFSKSFYDMNWNKVNPEKYNPEYANSNFKKPENFDEMVRIAKKLSEGFIFIRVDLYSIGNKIFFGELTFFSNGAAVRSIIEKYNTEMGDLIKLPI